LPVRRSIILALKAGEKGLVTSSSRSRLPGPRTRSRDNYPGAGAASRG
jgi:hypothetical protein